MVVVAVAVVVVVVQEVVRVRSVFPLDAERPEGHPHLQAQS